MTFLQVREEELSGNPNPASFTSIVTRIKFYRGWYLLKHTE
jgi:hypothetical protein